jgi:hypothetical protein
MKFLGVQLASFAKALLGSAQEISRDLFSSVGLSNWTEKSFKGNTRYELVRDVDLNRMVVLAKTECAASARFKKITVDLPKTPAMRWSWKIDKPYVGIDENTKAGDDFPVRVYVLVEHGFLGVSSKALNYVWASKNPVGASWPNPFTSQARMVAVNSGAFDAGRWVNHRRNVHEDLKAAFGARYMQSPS